MLQRGIATAALAVLAAVLVALAGCLGGAPALGDGTADDAAAGGQAPDPDADGDGATAGEAPVSDGDGDATPRLRDRVDVRIHGVARAERLVDRTVHRPPAGTEFVVVNVTFTGTAGRDGASTDLAPSLVADGTTHGLHGSRVHPRQLEAPTAPANGTVDGVLVYTVPRDASVTALGIAAADATAGAGDAATGDTPGAGTDGDGDGWRVPIGAVDRIRYAPPSLTVVGHEVFSRGTPSGHVALAAVFPRVTNEGGLPARVTGVALVVGEERADCTADSTVAPGATVAVSVRCDWRGEVGGADPSFDPGTYTARLTVLANGTAVASGEQRLALR